MERQIIKEIVLDRKYRVLTENSEYIKCEKPDKVIVKVFFSVFLKLNTSAIKNYIALLQNDNIHHAIIIYNNEITSATKKIIKNLYQIKIELFAKQELQINITKHFLVPKHIQLSVEESNIIKKKYGVQLPVILKSDPISRYFDFEIGRVIKIVRRPDNNITFRIVR